MAPMLCNELLARLPRSRKLLLDGETSPVSNRENDDESSSYRVSHEGYDSSLSKLQPIRLFKLIIANLATKKHPSFTRK